MQELIKQDVLFEQKKEINRFKFQAAIAYPDSAQRIFAQKEEEDIPDIEEFDPENPGFSDEGISTMLEAMEKLGFYIEDVE